MATEIGSKGLAEVNLTIPQGTSLSFDVVHTGPDDTVVDHSQSSMRMAFQSRDGKRTYPMDGCCSADAERIRVSVPASATAALPVGKLNWDLIVSTALGEQVRVCYGQVSVVDSYALDGE